VPGFDGDSTRASPIDVSLREVAEADLPIFFEHQLDPESTRMAAFPSRNREEFMAHWARNLQNPTAVNRTIVANGEAAGNVVCWEQEGERRIGYWIGREYWGHGIATQALSQFLNQIGRPLAAHVAKHNAASIRVLQKCGFSISGDETYLDPDGATGGELILTLHE